MNDTHHGNYESGAIERRRIEENRTPTGLPREILEWVGVNPERAQRVLDQELASAKPRKTVVQPLEELIENASISAKRS